MAGTPLSSIDEYRPLSMNDLVGGSMDLPSERLLIDVDRRG